MTPLLGLKKIYYQKNDPPNYYKKLTFKMSNEVHQAQSEKGGGHRLLKLVVFSHQRPDSASLAGNSSDGTFIKLFIILSVYFFIFINLEFFVVDVDIFVVVIITVFSLFVIVTFVVFNLHSKVYLFVLLAPGTLFSKFFKCQTYC